MTESSHDVLIVGAGPAGLAAALHLKRHHPDLTIALLEKSARIGAHLLSGALLDPHDLLPLLSPEEIATAPLGPEVIHETLLHLTRHHAIPLPHGWSHRGCRMLALGSFCRWLAGLAEQAGVEIYPGFAARELLWEGERLLGIRTGDQGVNGRGEPGPGFEPGLAMHAPVTILAEGCRGHLTGQAIRKLDLKRGRPPQTHGLGFKELWEIPTDRTVAGVVHTLGWPLAGSQHGGGFLYPVAPGRLAIGWVVGLDYRDPWFDPFVAFQQWKNHPRIRARLVRGQPLAFGARALVEGGWQCLPRLEFDGGVLIGDAAGFLDAARLKGIGNAIRSGVAAAEGVIAAFETGDFTAAGLRGYPDRVEASAWMARLKEVRNVRPGFRAGWLPGLVNAAWERFSRGRSPWSWRWSIADRARLQEVTPDRSPPTMPAPAPWILDRSTALALSAIRHRHDQPCHLRVQDPERLANAGRTRFANPETRYCPAGVYEARCPPEVERTVTRIRAERCLHCKCCDIKDPLDTLVWTPPEGGSGPDYGAM
ncbi:Electron transfer flavoprotein-ubiquinone oxidoreductase [Candidatus Magnetaquicoccaceae bacterium FCR-1]|uniref:Electron transfer flavoprotein-ubiquinone oxidoreductase n=1 Tax=Candidatus Magnetaquiglobus chichijimensis TaxID=3141448 RepID=A0ABQ0C4D9_9PROT